MQGVQLSCFLTVCYLTTGTMKPEHPVNLVDSYSLNAEKLQEKVHCLYHKPLKVYSLTGIMVFRTLSMNDFEFLTSASG